MILGSTATTNISIHALREEGDNLLVQNKGTTKVISIHALREEGDLQKQPLHLCGSISIHALREEGDLCDFGLVPVVFLFLSTPSARRATRFCGMQSASLNDFYPRPPRGGRPPRRERWLPTCPISIHALREEGDIRQDVPNHALF